MAFKGITAFILGNNKGGGTPGESDNIWKPTVSSNGEITQRKSTSTTTPDPQNIKGPKGDDGDTGETGLGIKSTDINAQNHLIITYDDDTTQDAGLLPSSTVSVAYTGTASSTGVRKQQMEVIRRFSAIKLLRALPTELVLAVVSVVGG